MISLQTPVCDFGWKAADFDLPGVDGGRYSLRDVRGPNGLLAMFICNHCPYVKAVRPRLIRDCAALREHGVGVAAIMSNDAADYPEDSFDNMGKVAADWGFPFPYLWDETQAVAKAYGAVCTPDFFGFNAALELQYRGRLDASGREPAPDDAARELLDAMLLVARTGRGPQHQIPSMGCSIKWRAE